MIAQRPIDRAVPPTHVMGVARFERFFRTAAGVNVDKQDLKRYSDFINHKVYDLLVRGVAIAKANDRNLIEPIDLPITKGVFRQVTEQPNRKGKGRAETNCLSGPTDYGPRTADLEIRTAASQSSSNIVGSEGEPSPHREPPRTNAISAAAQPWRCQTASRKMRIASKPSRTVIFSVAFGKGVSLVIRHLTLSTDPYRLV